MKIDVNAKAIRRLAGYLRKAADDLESLIDTPVPGKPKEKSKHFEDIKLIVSYYQETHPGRGRAIKQDHPDWKLIEKRLKDGYKLDELKSAISENARSDWWVKNGRHSIKDVFGKDGNLDNFIKGESGARYGYSAGSSSFRGDTSKGFGD
tara:strand:+ start:3115 stop:3564 length:450 start_codon:yes stop_codon:yes gene_type:complete